MRPALRAVLEIIAFGRIVIGFNHNLVGCLFFCDE